MLLLRNIGDAISPDLKVVQHRQFQNLPNRELLTDAPGLNFSCHDDGRSTYDEGDPHYGLEEDFVVSASAELETELHSDASGAIVIAPPAALGILRKNYLPRTRGKLIAEIGEDFTRLPVPDIARRLLAF